MSKSLQTTPLAVAVHQPKHRARPYEKKRHLSRWIGTTIIGFPIGYVLGTLAPAIGETFGISSEGISAIAAVAVAGFTWALVRANAASARHAEDTLAHLHNATERDQRGYVMYQQSVNPSPTGLTIILRNFGKTPVRNVQVFGHISFAPVDAFGPLLAHGYAAERTMISLAPSGEYWVEFRRHSAAQNSTQREYLHGRIEYTDAFGRRRYTWFRYWIRSDHSPQNCIDGNHWT